jgi:hypothetical protein
VPSDIITEGATQEFCHNHGNLDDSVSDALKGFGDITWGFVVLMVVVVVVVVVMM